MPITIPKTCPGGLHRLEWIVDGEVAICKNGHEGILWVVAEHNRLRCETNPVARALAKFVAENRIVRQNPTEDQTAVSVQIAENIMAREEIDASTVMHPLFLHTLLRDVESAPRKPVAVQIKAIVEVVPVMEVVVETPMPIMVIEIPDSKPLVQKISRKNDGALSAQALRGKKNNAQFLPANTASLTHAEYKEWRSTIKKTHREVAELLTISRGLVSDIDTGRRPYSSFVSYQFSMYMKDKASQGA